MCQPTGGVRRTRFNAASSIELLMSKWQTYSDGLSSYVIPYSSKVT